MAMNTIQTAGQEQLIVTLSDASLVNSIKKAISMIRGVENVRTTRSKKKLTRIERSMKEVESGKLHEAKDVDDLFVQLND